MPDDILLFVYGTLRPRGTKGGVREVGEHLGQAIAQGKLFRVAHFPGAIFGDSGPIVGNIFKISSATLARLDMYEGCRYPAVEENLYNRVRITVTREREFEVKDEEVECWAYEYNRADELVDDLLIPSGDWFDEAHK